MSLLWLLFLPAIAYQILSVVASLRQFFRQPPNTGYLPPVSFLKAVRGIDPDMHAALASHATLDYPEFEILFGASNESDPAIPEIERLQREFPDVPIRLVIGAQPGTNGKVGVLANLSRFARHPVWVVNDSDIRVTPGYLREIVAPLADPRIGVVTCLYRPDPFSPASAWEAFGIAVDFMPSTLVAPLVGVREFGLGSTLAFRAGDLADVGGFLAISDYLADDYQLSKRINSLGKQTYLSTYVVDTSLGDQGWNHTFQHQLRWARTIRVSKGRGYAGLPVTHAGLWMLVALALHLWPVAVILLALRTASALASGWLVLRLEPTALYAALAPLWDLYAFVVWIASYMSNEVRWRDRRLMIGKDGRLAPLNSI